MRIATLLFTVLVLTGLSFGVPASAQDGDFETAAEYAIIMDYRTGDILFEKNARVPTAPASMSKLMTVAIAFEKLKDGTLQLDQPFDVSEKAWRMGGSKMWVRVDTQIPLIDLLRGVIIQSGNDACIVIAENIAGSEAAFAELMNRKAREWGMNDSTFANATGWPDENQKMSMRDLALLTRKIISEFPDYYALFEETEFEWEKIRQANRNPLLTIFDGADGLKTGHTEESGYGLVGSAKRSGERRIVVVNGLESERQRATESARLMRIAFDDYVTKTFYQRGDIVGEAAVFRGKAGAAPLAVAESITLTMHRSKADDVRMSVTYEGPIVAPVADNQQIGFLRIEAPGGPSREYPLYAEKGVHEAGVFGKIGLAAKSLLAKPARPAEETAQ